MPRLSTLTFPQPLRWLVALWSGLAILLIGAAGRAEPGAPEPVRIDYRGPIDCGSAERFLRRVFARTPLAREANETEPARTFRVSIRSDGDGLFSGELVVTDAAQPMVESGRRAIAGESCAEIFDALALFAALAVDPEASTAALPAETAVVAKRPVASSESAPATPSPSVAPTALGSVRPAEGRPLAETLTWRAEAGAHAGAMSAGLSSTLLLVMPFLEVGFERASTPAVRLAPAVRLWFSSTGGSTLTTVEGPARLRWTTARVDACPLEIRVLPVLAGRPCLALSGGVLDARGETIAHPASVRRPWVSVGGLIRLEWELFRFLSVEVAGGVDLPLERDAFHFEPATHIYRVPAALGHGSAGLGVHFP